MLFEDIIFDHQEEIAYLNYNIHPHKNVLINKNIPTKFAGKNITIDNNKINAGIYDTDSDTYLLPFSDLSIPTEILNKQQPIITSNYVSINPINNISSNIIFKYDKNIYGILDIDEDNLKVHYKFNSNNNLIDNNISITYNSSQYSFITSNEYNILVFNKSLRI